MKLKPCSSYEEPNTSKISSGSSVYSDLHQKQRRKTQFILIFCRVLLVSSKDLEFLSFHIVYQMFAGIIFHLSFLSQFPPIVQHVKTLEVLPGFTHFIRLRLMNKSHSCLVVVQCKNR